MKPFVILIGGSGSGKSTIITSFTGCPSRNYRGLVKDQSTKRQIYVIASSPQESDIPIEDFTEILRTVHRTRSVIGLVAAIQPTYPYRHLSLEDIVQAAQTNGNFSIFAYVLDPAYSKNGMIDVVDTRSRLNNLEVVARYLDARRFAHLNASEIRSTVGIP
ncbi:MAG: hypothetical protein HYX82_00735 [Chloroflexi bacterium]|nr:hypothetical protein [Chloroflexota bacterium]